MLSSWRAARPLIIAALLLSSMVGARAWDGTISGKVTFIDGVGGSAGAPGNFDLRVALAGVPETCGMGTPNWAYINANDANYKSLMALLLMARAAANPVTLYTTKDSRGYCQIGYISLLPA